MIKIKWLAHASFLIEGDGLRIITDPYEPNEEMNLPAITESADIVIRSSDDDEAHSYTETIPSGFETITATEAVEKETTVKGLLVNGIWAEESHIHKHVVRDNAMYSFTLGGIQITHMGDVGNPLTNRQLEQISNTDVLLALTGGPPTIELKDLKTVIEAINPKIVIPMHYRIPGPRFFMLPVEAFTADYPEEMVEFVEGTEIELTAESLPKQTKIIVLQPTLYRLESAD
ncbi:MAG: MBL fold metallo-hydrolase [Chloroflexota bacterium]